MISRFSPRKCVRIARLSALPELSRTTTWIFGPAHEHACAILEIATGPCRFVGSRIESCKGLTAGVVCGLQPVCADSVAATTPCRSRPPYPVQCAPAVAHMIVGRFVCRAVRSACRTRPDHSPDFQAKARPRGCWTRSRTHVRPTVPFRQTAR